MPTEKIFLCGNSHVAAMKRGYQQLFPKGGDLVVFPLGNGSHEREPFSKLDAGGVAFTAEKYAENLKTHSGQRTITASKSRRWGICLGTQTARIYAERYWADCEPASICGQGKQPVTDSVIRALIEEDQRHVRDFFSQLHQCAVQVFAVSCAPPRLDHPCISHGVRRQTVAYLDHAARASLTEFLANLGIDFISPPPECQTEDGFLRPEFNRIRKKGGHDKHHADDVYGARMIERILAYTHGT